jgi:hypothetical protein
LPKPVRKREFNQRIFKRARGVAVSRCRSKAARHLVEGIGLPLAEAARQLGVCTSAIWDAVRRENEKQAQVNALKDVP